MDMEEREMAKITKATFKSFINRNRERLLIRCESSFDGMTDGVEQARNPQFKPATAQEPRTAGFDVTTNENTLGINGVWLVGQSRDYFTPFSENDLTGIHVYNCCGSFDVAVREGA
jgi:hypothetical protein